MFNSYGTNPYFNPYYNPQQTQIPMKSNNFGLQGKSIDNLEVVKAMDIPLDGSVSYFPLADGTAIVTKQLQQDGTSKIVIFKPIENTEEPTTKYATLEDLENKMNSIQYITPEELDNKLKAIKMPDTKGIQDDIKTIKKQIRILLDKED
jgi:hypothetical protein